MFKPPRGPEGQKSKNDLKRNGIWRRERPRFGAEYLFIFKWLGDLRADGSTELPPAGWRIGTETDGQPWPSLTNREVLPNLFHTSRLRGADVEQCLERAHEH
jgi:hypothetical protein